MPLSLVIFSGGSRGRGAITPFPSPQILAWQWILATIKSFDTDENIPLAGSDPRAMWLCGYIPPTARQCIPWHGPSRAPCQWHWGVPEWCLGLCTHMLSAIVCTLHYSCSLLLGRRLECGMVFSDWNLLPRTLIQALYCSTQLPSIASKITNFFRKVWGNRGCICL